MNLKGNKGITLIALVITIIILLILAGVTISMVLGDDGIIANAQAASKQQKEAEELELAQLAVTTARADELAGTNKTSIQAELDELFGEGKATYENGIITIEESKNQYEVTAEGKVIKKAGTVIPEEPEETPANSNIASYTTDTIPVPIPKGFEYVEGTRDTGVVIRNITDGNEFVWVPVEGELELVDWPNNSDPGTDGEEYLEEMKRSVTTNGGFYVGRYETGKDASGKAVSQKGAEAYIVEEDTEESFNILYNAQKALYTHEDETVGAVSGMIWGSQWDAIMKWIQSDDSTITNSESIGNYWKWVDCGNCSNGYASCPECGDSCGGGNSDCDICGESGFSCTYCFGGGITCGECNWLGNDGYVGEYDYINSGTNDAYKVKNIYDMAGNYRRNN